MSPTVLILGMPRSGTQSISGALQELGLPHIYHMREVAKNSHQSKWIALLDAKYGPEQRQVQDSELEKILKPFDAIADFPASVFVEELIAAYPTAKVVLAAREEDKWYDSMLATLWHNHTDPAAPRLGAMRPLAEKLHECCWAGDFPANGRQFSRDYMDRVRRIVPPERLLEYNVKQGWEPLCTFLGLPIPNIAFPRVDAWTEYKATYRTDTN